MNGGIFPVLSVLELGTSATSLSVSCGGSDALTNRKPHEGRSVSILFTTQCIRQAWPVVKGVGSGVRLSGFKSSAYPLCDLH